MQYVLAVIALIALMALAIRICAVLKRRSVKKQEAAQQVRETQEKAQRQEDLAKKEANLAHAWKTARWEPDEDGNYVHVGTACDGAPYMVAYLQRVQIVRGIWVILLELAYNVGEGEYGLKKIRRTNRMLLIPPAGPIVGDEKWAITVMDGLVNEASNLMTYLEDHGQKLPNSARAGLPIGRYCLGSWSSYEGSLSRYYGHVPSGYHELCIFRDGGWLQVFKKRRGMPDDPEMYFLESLTEAGIIFCTCSKQDLQATINHALYTRFCGKEPYEGAWADRQLWEAKAGGKVIEQQ